MSFNPFTLLSCETRGSSSGSAPTAYVAARHQVLGSRPCGRTDTSLPPCSVVRGLRLAPCSLSDLHTQSVLERPGYLVAPPSRERYPFLPSARFTVIARARGTFTPRRQVGLFVYIECRNKSQNINKVWIRSAIHNSVTLRLHSSNGPLAGQLLTWVL